MIETMYSDLPPIYYEYTDIYLKATDPFQLIAKARWKPFIGKVMSWISSLESVYFRFRIAEVIPDNSWRKPPVIWEE